MSVVILDFGSQYTRLIARRMRKLRAYSVILPGRATVEQISRHDPQAVILSGGPASVLQPGAPHPDERLFDLNLPILGICYDMQYLVQRLADAHPHRPPGSMAVPSLPGPQGHCSPGWMRAILRYG